MLKGAITDFKIGYFGTMILAFCFLLLGANVLYMGRTELQAGATGFASQLITMYTSTLGSWAYPIIGISAFATIVSFLVAPIFAYLNYRIIKLCVREYSFKFGRLENIIAILGLLLITSFSFYYLILIS